MNHLLYSVQIISQQSLDGSHSNMGRFEALSNRHPFMRPPRNDCWNILSWLHQTVIKVGSLLLIISQPSLDGFHSNMDRFEALDNRHPYMGSPRRDPFMGPPIWILAPISAIWALAVLISWQKSINTASVMDNWRSWSYYSHFIHQETQPLQQWSARVVLLPNSK